MNPILGISRFFYRAAAWPLSALFYSCLVTGYILAFTLPLHFLEHNHTMKIVYSVFVALPLPFTWWFLLRGFIWPIFNKKKNDDYNAHVFSYLFALIAKILSMSSIYMIMYIWDHKTFEVISVDSRLNAWAMFIALASYLTIGNAPPSTFDTTAPLSALIAALDIFMSFAMNFIIFVTIVSRTLRKVDMSAVRVASKSNTDDENGDF